VICAGAGSGRAVAACGSSSGNTTDSAGKPVVRIMVVALTSRSTCPPCSPTTRFYSRRAWTCSCPTSRPASTPKRLIAGRSTRWSLLRPTNTTAGQGQVHRGGAHCSRSRRGGAVAADEPNITSPAELEGQEPRQSRVGLVHRLPDHTCRRATASRSPTSTNSACRPAPLFIAAMQHRASTAG